MKTNSNPVLVLGIGDGSKTSLDYMKTSGIRGVDFLFPDENLSAKDLADYKLIFLVAGKLKKTASEMAVRLACVAKESAVLTRGCQNRHEGWRLWHFYFGQASGKDRVNKAVLQAVPAPSTISYHSGNILLYMYSGQDEITIGDWVKSFSFSKTR